jgi:hypothetical protein
MREAAIALFLVAGMIEKEQAPRVCSVHTFLLTGFPVFAV